MRMLGINPNATYCATVEALVRVKKAYRIHITDTMIFQPFIKCSCQTLVERKRLRTAWFFEQRHCTARSLMTV